MRPTTASPAAAGRGAEPPPKDHSRLTTGTLLASSTMTIMAAAVIAPSLPQMREVFAHVPAADVLVRLALTVTSLSIGLTAPVAGLVADRLGRKPVLVSSLLLYAAAGVGAYFTTDIYLLLGTRALLGVAVGGIMTAVTAVITDLHTGPRRRVFLGLQSTFASLGGVVFLPLAGVLAGIAWNAPFWIYIASLLIVPFVVLAVPDTGPRVGSSPGATPTATDDARSSGARRLVAAIYLLAMAGTLLFFMAPTQLPFLLQEFDVSPTVVGVVVAGSTVSSALASTGYARLRRLIGQETITALSLALLGAGWIVVGTAGSVVQVVLGLLLGGIGVGLVVPNLNLWASESVPDTRRGRVLGGLVSAIFLGQFLSPVVLQPVVSALGIGGAFNAARAGAVAAAALVALVLRPRTPDRSTSG